MNIVVISKYENLLSFGASAPNDGNSNRFRIKFVRGRGTTQPRILGIYSESDFNPTSINSFLNSGDPNENQVFIYLEGWEEGSFNKGYEMARELLKTVGSDKPFNLRFVSKYSREQLLKIVNKEHKVFVEAFPHLRLSDREVQIPPEAYSTVQFRLIRDIAISDSGHLSLIKHEVKNVVEENLDACHLGEIALRFKQHTLKILDDLDCEAYHHCYNGCKNALSTLTQKANEITKITDVDDFKSESIKLQDEILQLIQEISLRLPHGEQPTSHAKKAYRVLIIEDNIDQRRSLYRFFNNHYEFVTCNDMEETIPNEYEKWEKQIEEVYCFNLLRKKEAVEELLHRLDSNERWSYEDLLSMQKKLEDIVHGTTAKKMKNECERFSEVVSNFLGRNAIPRGEWQPLAVALKHIINALEKNLNNETKHYYEILNTITLKNQGAAMAWFNNIKEAGSLFDIIILDLLLKDEDNSTWFPFNGLDLLINIRKELPYSTVRIITSLPRHEIGGIMKEENIVLPMNQIFTKGNGWPQLEGCLYDRLDEINNECLENENRRRVAEEICMPNKGEFFSHFEVREYAQKLILEETFEDVFEKAKSLIDSPNTANIKLMGNHGFKKDRIETYFVNYLAHRYAFLKWATTTGNQIRMQGINFTSYAKFVDEQPYYPIDRNVSDKTYYFRIGFSVKQNCVNLDGRTMFPKELDYFIDQMYSRSYIQEISKVTMRWCVTVIRRLCDDNGMFVENTKYEAFCNAIDQGRLNLETLVNFLKEFQNYSQIDSNAMNLLHATCHQPYFKKMPEVIVNVRSYSPEIAELLFNLTN